MKKNLEPIILIDKNRLQEIYNLRVTAYENSLKNNFVNKRLYTDGLFDDLDKKNNTIHWIIEDNNKIIASARVAIIENHEDFKDFKVEIDSNKINTPFAYFSRLAIHQGYRRIGLAQKLDEIRVNYLKDNKNISLTIAACTKNRDQALIKYGFKFSNHYNFKMHGKFEGIEHSIYYLLLN